MLSNKPLTCHANSTQIANRSTFGVTYTTIFITYIQYVTDAWTPLFYTYNLIVILFYFLNI